MTQDVNGRSVLALPRRSYSLLLVALFASAAALAWKGREPLRYQSGDEFTYMALAEQLQSGSYREAFRPSAPVHVQYPPGYPAWIATVSALSGGGTEVFQRASVALMLVGLMGTFILARAIGGLGFGLAVMVPLAFNPSILWMGGAVYSEALFTALSIAALVFAKRTDENARSASPVIALSLLAFLTRTVGISLVAAVGSWLFSRRRWRDLALHGALSTVIVGGWFAFQASAYDPEMVRSYSAEFVRNIEQDRTVSALSLAVRIAHNIEYYASVVVPVELYQPTLPGTLVDNVSWLFFNLLFLAVGAVVLWRRSPLVVSYLAAYAVILSVWTWPINRFLGPVIPVLYLALLHGAWHLTAPLDRRLRDGARMLLVLLLSAGSLRGTGALLLKWRECDRLNPLSSSGCYAPADLALIKAIEFIRDSTPTESQVLSHRPAAVRFLSGHVVELSRLVEHVPQGQLPDTLRSRGIAYLLLTALTHFERETLGNALAASCAGLTVRATFRPDAYVLSLRGPAADEADACNAMAEFRVRHPREPYDPQ